MNRNVHESRAFFYKSHTALRCRVLSTELRDNSNLQLCDGRVLVDINDSSNSILLLRSTASRGDSQCFCKHSEEDVLESVFECWNRHFAKNDILIAFFCAPANRLAARDYLAGRDTIFCSISSFL